MASSTPRTAGDGSTSRTLLSRVRTRDGPAWERFVRLYAPLVLHWCRRSGLDEPDAADVAQEVFRRVASGIAGFAKRDARDTFRGWLRVVTMNQVRDHGRRRAREPRAAGGSGAWRALSQVPARAADPARPAEPAGDVSGERRLVRRALDLIRPDFTERTWLAFRRTAVDGCSATDVAAELSMSPGAVRVAKSRVLKRLREELGDLPSTGDPAPLGSGHP